MPSVGGTQAKPEKLSVGVVIEGFPESGLAGTIASTCLVSSLKLPAVEELSSEYFPPLATVLDGKLQAPARIYADPKQNIAIFMGDFSPGLRASNLIAKEIIRWAKEKSASFVLTSFSTPMEEGSDEHVVSAVVNGQEAEEVASKASIPLAKLAAVGGVAGRLLLEGRDNGVPVVALLIRIHKGIRDYESGLKLAEVIMKMVPNAYCDLEGIRAEAEKTERNLRKVWRQTAPPGIYG
ncbi:MAG: proteasome assembly chaperone family protein [Nitrososphaerota archaeon]|nr:proteasome assembly chaperone family protein [Nitrososphaerota archaeon]